MEKSVSPGVKLQTLKDQYINASIQYHQAEKTLKEMRELMTAIHHQITGVDLGVALHSSVVQPQTQET